MYAEEERMLKKNVSWRRTCRVVEVENNEEEIEGENNEEEIEGENSEEEVGEVEDSEVEDDEGENGYRKVERTTTITTSYNK